MTATASRSKKVLAPLAVLLAAGALAVGSGATFTSASNNTISAVTSGTLTHSNTKANSAIFNLTNIKPGDVVNGRLTITNTGTLPATFGLTEVSSTNDFGPDYLTLTITDTTTGKVAYTGNFGGLEDNAKQNLGVIEPGVANDFTFSVKLAADAPNSQQGKTASAVYAWDSVQLDATTTNQ